MNLSSTVARAMKDPGNELEVKHRDKNGEIRRVHVLSWLLIDEMFPR